MGKFAVIKEREVMSVDDKSRMEIEAATFRHLVNFLRENTDVQNIDLMNLAGFCRNCISKWYLAEAGKKGIEMNYDEARKTIYGMPYSEWKDKFQKEGTSGQLKSYDQSAE